MTTRGVSGIHENDIHNPEGVARGIMNSFECIPDTPRGEVMLYMACIDRKP